MKKSLISVAILTSLGLSGCFSSSSSSSTLDADPIVGQAVDGYLSGMFCYADVDGNGAFGTGDIAALALTDSSGNYSFAGTTGADSYPVVCRAEAGATDSATGSLFYGQLSAAAGSSFVTPMTTLLQEMTEDEIKSSFGGLLDGVVLNGDPTQSIALAQATVTINTIVSAISQMLYVQSGNDTTNIDEPIANAIAKTVFTALAEQILAKETANPGSVDLTDSASALGTVIQNTVVSATVALTGDATATNDDKSILVADIENTIDAIVATYSTVTTLDELDAAQADAETALETNLDLTAVSDTLVIADGIVDTSDVPADVSGATSTTDLSSVSGGTI